MLVYIFSCKSVCPTQPAHSKLQSYVEDKTSDFISSVAHLILNYPSQQKKVFYNYSTPICTNIETRSCI